MMVWSVLHNKCSDLKIGCRIIGYWRSYLTESDKVSIKSACKDEHSSSLSGSVPDAVGYIKDIFGAFADGQDFCGLDFYAVSAQHLADLAQQIPAGRRQQFP